MASPAQLRGSMSATSCLAVSLVGKVEYILKSPIPQQFIRFGSVQLSIAVEIQLDRPLFPQQDLVNFFSDVQIWIDVVFFEKIEEKRARWGTDQLVFAAGLFCPWAFSDRTDAYETATTTQDWRHLLMAESASVQLLVENFKSDKADAHGPIPCHFVGRVVNATSRRTLQLKSDLLPLWEKGVLIELEFYYNRNEEARTPGVGLPKGAYKFCVFLLFDDTNFKRYPFIRGTSQTTVGLKEGQVIYCEGDIIGQIDEQYVEHAGFEQGTPVEWSPVLVVHASRELRMQDSRGAASSATSSPSKDKLNRRRIKLSQSSAVASTSDLFTGKSRSENGDVVSADARTEQPDDAIGTTDSARVPPQTVPGDSDAESHETLGVPGDDVLDLTGETVNGVRPDKGKGPEGRPTKRRR